MILVDTSVWIDFLKGKNTFYRKKLHELIENDEDICITEIILTEILQGIRDDEIFQLTRKYLQDFTILKPKGIETYIMAAEIYRRCRREGKTVRKTIDCIIAAIAIEHGATLFHNDKDYEKIKECVGLKTFY